MFSHHTKVSSRSAFKATPLPAIPKSVALDDLDATLRLTSPPQQHPAYSGIRIAYLPKQPYDIAALNGDEYQIYNMYFSCGAGSWIHPAQHTQTRNWVACKTMFAEGGKFTTREVGILSKLNLLTTSTQDNAPFYFQNVPTTFMRHSSIARASFLFMKFYPHPTFLSALGHDYKNNLLSSLTCLNLATNLIDKNIHLIQSGLVHGDLHQDNILVNLPHETVEIIDFGAAVYLPPNEDASQRFHFDIRLLLTHLEELMSRTQWLEQTNQEKKEAFRRTFEDSKSSRSTKNSLIEMLLDFKLEIARQRQALPLQEKRLVVGLLNISDFLAGNALPANLKQCHEIWIVDPEHCGTLQDYLKCHRALMNANRVVGDQVLHHPQRLGLSYHVSRMVREHHPQSNVRIIDAVTGVKYQLARRVPSNSQASEPRL